MNAEIYGTAKLTFSVPTEHKTKELAMYDAGFKVDDDAVSHYEVYAVNHQGVKTRLKVWEHKVELLEMFDENGLPV